MLELRKPLLDLQQLVDDDDVGLLGVDPTGLSSLAISSSISPTRATGPSPRRPVLFSSLLLGAVTALAIACPALRDPLTLMSASICRRKGCPRKTRAVPPENSVLVIVQRLPFGRQCDRCS